MEKKKGRKKVSDYKSIEHQVLEWEPICGNRERPDLLWKKLMEMPYFPDGVEIHGSIT
jgi:hypothetical protein